MSQTNQTPTLGSTGPKGSEPGPTQRKRILLVEGDGFTRLVLLLRLRLAGFAVDFTSNGILGLGKLRSCHPDVLLMELKLCGLSGLDLIKAARGDPTFGNRPIYVFTDVDQMNRVTRKEVARLDLELFDKRSTTREDLVQIFAATFSVPESAGKHPPVSPATESPVEMLNAMLLPGAIEEIIDGVREQTKLVAGCGDAAARLAGCGELLSRVCSLASCADAAGLPDLNRQAKALETFLNQLCHDKQGYTDAGLSTVTRAVDLMRLMSPGPAGKKQDLSQFTAVVVDEAPLSNKAIKQALLKAGFTPIAFENSTRALDHLATNSTDLVIANVVLPEAHGLALADIRRLPRHAETPVIFVPESSVLAHSNGELEHSAPRLETEPLLLKELIVKALNEVQSTDTPGPASPVSASPAPASAPGVSATSSPQAGSPLDDGFEMFAVPKRPEQDRAIQAPADRPLFAVPQWSCAKPVPAAASLSPASLAADENAEPISAQFTTTSLRCESLPSAESGATDAEGQAELLSRLPATSTDELQTDDLPVEMLQPSGLQQESPEPPKPEPTLEDLIAEAERLAAAESEAGQPVPATNTDSQPEENQAPSALESTAATPSHEQEAGDQLQAAQGENAQEAEGAQAGEAMENYKHGREELAARICAAEMELYRREKTIEALQARLEELTAGKTQPGSQLEAETPDSAAEKEAQARCAQLEQELAELRQAREELNGSLAQEQQVTAELRARLKELEPQSQSGEAGGGAQITDLEQQVRQGVAALTRATADLAKERGERQRSEQRTAVLNARLQELHEDFSRTVQLQRDDLERARALEEQLHQTEQALALRTADVEQQQAERCLAEEQLRKAKELNAQLRKNLSFFEEANKTSERTQQDLQARLEASLNAARDREANLHREGAEGQRRAETQDGVQRELQDQSRRRQTLEKELQTTLDALHECEARLEKETGERQRLNEALESAQLSLRDRSERSELEFSKLQSALQFEQVERQRQEAQLARTRLSSVDGVRAARALRNSLRRQVREPIDNLYNSARSLLELEMGEQQKKLAEAVLQDVLLVHTRLREPEMPKDDSAETEGSPSTTPV